MDDLLGRIAAICIAVLFIVIIMTVVQSRGKKKLLKENERLQEIIEAKNRQVHDMAAQNKVFGETLKKTLVDENEVLSSGGKAVAEPDDDRLRKEKYLNLVLDLERLSCEKNDIDLRANINISGDKLPFSETDLVRLFCNLLDNAIEAAGGRKDAYIEFAINDNDDQIKILVENSKDSLLKPLENDFSTTKEEKDVHGRGVGIIKGIVAKYNGKISWEDLGDKFITKIII